MEETPMRRTLHSIKLILIVSIWITLACAAPLMAGSQVIRLLPQEIAIAPGGSAEIAIAYDVMQGKMKTSGLALRIHYDSTVIESIRLQDCLGDGLVGVGTVAQKSVKAMGADGSADKFLSIGWLDVVSNWPNFQNLPLDLGKIIIKVKPDAGIRSAIIDVTAIDVPAGYTFEGHPCLIKIQ
jgi:hypothetical protein